MRKTKRKRKITTVYVEAEDPDAKAVPDAEEDAVAMVTAVDPTRNV